MAEPADPAAGAARLAAVLDRVRAAPRGGANGAVTDEDVAWLAALGAAAQADALDVLTAGTGAQKSVLKTRLREAQRLRRTDTRGQLRLVREGDEEALLNWKALLRYNREGDLLGTVGNFAEVLRHRYAGRLSFNTMALCPCLDGRPMRDEDVTAIRAEVDLGERCSVHVGDARAGIVMVAKETREFSPVADYLRDLKHDGTPRLWTIARDHLGLDDAYANRVMGRTMVAAVARGLVREHAPLLGCMVKTITILLGQQDAKKSTFWRTVGGPFFGDSKVDIEDRKGNMTLGFFWFYEWPEIDGMLSRYANEAMKAWLGQQDDTFVTMFGTAPAKFPRTFLPVGTTNRAKFLTDPTGSTRYHVLDLRQNGPEWAVDDAKLEDKRDQILAEAVIVFDRYLAEKERGTRGDANPHRWWMNREENRERARRNEAFQVESAWAPTVGAWLAGAELPCQPCRGTGGPGQSCSTCTGRGRAARGPLAVDEHGREYVTLDRVLSEALGVPVERHAKLRGDLAETLAGLGWHPGTRRVAVTYPNGRTGRVQAYYQDDASDAGSGADGNDAAEPSWEDLERRRATLARELDALDAAQERRVRAGEVRIDEAP